MNHAEAMMLVVHLTCPDKHVGGLALPPSNRSITHVQFQRYEDGENCQVHELPHPVKGEVLELLDDDTSVGIFFKGFVVDPRTVSMGSIPDLHWGANNEIFVGYWDTDVGAQQVAEEAKYWEDFERKMEEFQDNHLREDW